MTGCLAAVLVARSPPTPVIEAQVDKRARISNADFQVKNGLSMTAS